MTPVVSIIVPIYNVEDYLEGCLTGICRQTIEDIEIICVNDGSTDGSAEIVRTMANQDKRIRLIEQENQGVASARNTGLTHAQGTYIGFVDPDDQIAPTMFETLYRVAEEQQADMVQCAIEPIIECDNPQEEARMRRNFESWARLREGDWIERTCPLARFLSHELSNSLWNKLFRRIPHGCTVPLSFTGGMKSSEDLDFTGRYIAHCRIICNISTRLYFYRQSRAGSLMTDWKANLSSSLNDLQTALCQTISCWKQNRLLESHESELLAWIQRYVHTLCESGSPQYLARLADTLSSVPISLEHARPLPRRTRKRVSIVLKRAWFRLKVYSFFQRLRQKKKQWLSTCSGLAQNACRRRANSSSAQAHAKR